MWLTAQRVPAGRLARGLLSSGAGAGPRAALGPEPRAEVSGPGAAFFIRCGVRQGGSPSSGLDRRRNARRVRHRGAQNSLRIAGRGAGIDHGAAPGGHRHRGAREALGRGRRAGGRGRRGPGPPGRRRPGAGAPGDAPRRPAGRDPRDDHQQGLRERSRRHAARGHVDPHRRSGGRRRRRNGEHVARAVPPRQGAPGLPPRQRGSPRRPRPRRAARRLRRPAHGPDRGLGGRSPRHRPRGAGRVRGSLVRPRLRRDRGRGAGARRSCRSRRRASG